MDNPFDSPDTIQKEKVAASYDELVISVLELFRDAKYPSASVFHSKRSVSWCITYDGIRLDLQVVLQFDNKNEPTGFHISTPKGLVASEKRINSGLSSEELIEALKTIR